MFKRIVIGLVLWLLIENAVCFDADLNGYVVSIEYYTLISPQIGTAGNSTLNLTALRFSLIDDDRNLIAIVRSSKFFFNDPSELKEAAIGVASLMGVTDFPNPVVTYSASRPLTGILIFGPNQMKLYAGAINEHDALVFISDAPDNRFRNYLNGLSAIPENNTDIRAARILHKNYF